jgi:hypothetical protein
MQKLLKKLPEYFQQFTKGPQTQPTKRLFEVIWPKHLLSFLIQSEKVTLSVTMSHRLDRHDSEKTLVERQFVSSSNNMVSPDFPKAELMEKIGRIYSMQSPGNS